MVWLKPANFTAKELLNNTLFLGVVYKNIFLPWFFHSPCWRAFTLAYPCVTPPLNAIDSLSQKNAQNGAGKNHEKRLPCACGAHKVSFPPEYAVYTVYTAEIDQKRELVHFGELTPPLAGRIPEMQMPALKSSPTKKKIFFSNTRGEKKFYTPPPQKCMLTKC